MFKTKYLFIFLTIISVYTSATKISFNINSNDPFKVLGLEEGVNFSSILTNYRRAKLFINATVKNNDKEIKIINEAFLKLRNKYISNQYIQDNYYIKIARLSSNEIKRRLYRSYNSNEDFASLRIIYDEWRFRQKDQHHLLILKSIENRFFDINFSKFSMDYLSINNNKDILENYNNIISRPYSNKKILQNISLFYKLSEEIIHRSSSISDLKVIVNFINKIENSSLIAFILNSISKRSIDLKNSNIFFEDLYFLSIKILKTKDYHKIIVIDKIIKLAIQNKENKWSQELLKYWFDHYEDIDKIEGNIKANALKSRIDIFNKMPRLNYIRSRCIRKFKKLVKKY